jgi:hypothetical protein
MSKRNKPSAEIVTLVRGKVEHDYPRSFYERNKEALKKDGYSLKEPLKNTEVEQTVFSSPSNELENGTTLPN